MSSGVSHRFGFRNGIFDTRSATFVPYEEGADAEAPQLCRNHVDEVFDPAWCELALDAPEMQVKGVARILASQNYNRETCAFFYAMLGRLFFEVNECDRWDKLMVIKGMSCTGKTTIEYALVKLMGFSNVGDVSPLGDPQRDSLPALASLCGKALWMCSNVHGHLPLFSAQLQSMTAGELVTVREWFRDERKVQWTAPGLIVCTEEAPAPLTQEADGLSHRVVLFSFDNAPQPDPSVASDTLSNVAKLLVVAVREYHALVRRTGEYSLDFSRYRPLEHESALLL